jgi:hypothetical protein
MTIDTSTWLTFSDSKLAITFRYPETTPEGQPVRIEEKIVEASSRFHLRSADDREVYFEIGRYWQLSDGEVYRRFRQDIETRLAGLQVDEPSPTLVAGRPAARLAFRWAGKERVALFLEEPPGSYRVIYDPRSVVNREMLDTLAFE